MPAPRVKRTCYDDRPATAGYVEENDRYRDTGMRARPGVRVDVGLRVEAMNPPGQVVLDDVSRGCATVFEHPSHIFAARDPGDVPTVLARMQRARESGHYLAGYFSYELGYVLEPCLAQLLPVDRDVPLLWFGQFDAPPRQLVGDAARALWPDGRAYATPLVYAWDRTTYRQRFQSVLQAIRAGETYEVNLSMRARFRFTGDARAFYGRLRCQTLGAHSAFVDDGERQLLSLSPEMFFTIQPGGTITAQPMKGTAPRAAEPAADRALAERLRTSAKERAENVMVVDLLRNDLGRVAVTGTVTTPALFCVETYPTLHQMTSTVQATLRPRISIAELLRALYPCGSVTGTPKVRTMQIIRHLEESPRGAYCGAMGMFAPDGTARFNVAIRTLTLANGEGELGVGGAVTSGSDADHEYDECLLKARFYDVARRPLALLETLPYRRGTWPRQERHLRRMERSAQALGMPFDRAYADAVLEAAQHRYGERQRRVRLCLHEDGHLTVDSQAPPQRSRLLHFTVAEHRIRSDDPFNRHKTNWREANQRALAEARAQGADEAIFVNERGEVSEGTYTNVFIERDGRLVTPPLASGALPGCLREELVESGRCREATLTVHDLMCAERVFLGNSLRGLIAAAPVG